ncbi:hypothetical protein ACTIVE_7229 [Actinomadura verrucosospora]|uniref:Uncharacterized protein n=1 Tax=Actinomadura verrucosospora TaxID=46165 RepID=A0A7D3ZJM4_ACTVE|nr:hypothetical protein ACTIVE_7229 [Actinomadura verrucosospora]
MKSIVSSSAREFSALSVPAEPSSGSSIAKLVCCMLNSSSRHDT